MIIEDIINEKCVTFMTEEPMDNIQSAEYFKENILPNEVEITHDDGNYFEVSVNCKSYSCDVYGNGDFYHSIAEFKLLEGCTTSLQEIIVILVKMARCIWQTTRHY